MKTILLFLLLSAFPGILCGQEYSQAAGIRGGISSGIEYRYFLDYQNSGRLLLSSRDRGLQLHALFELHRYDLFAFSDRLVFIYGAGLHGGYERWNEEVTSGTVTSFDPRTRPLAGIDGLAGLEYSIYGIPLSAGIEVKPYIDLWGRYGFYVVPWDFAFTIRYLF